MLDLFLPINIKAGVMDNIKIISLLRKTDFFKSLSTEHLRLLCSKFSHISIKSDQILFNEGDSPDALYLVMYGRLRVLKAHESGFYNLGEIGQGGLVGEFALLTDQKSSATIKAIRDTHLLALSAQNFEKFLYDYPKDVHALWRTSLIRALKSSKSNLDEEIPSIKTIALVPNSQSLELKKAIKLICYEFASQASTLHLQQNTLEDILGITSDLTVDEVELRTNAWLSEQELNYRYIIYEANDQYSPWTQRCIRQADMSVMVAHAAELSELSKSEGLFSKLGKQAKINHLVLLHPSSTVQPMGAEKYTGYKPDIFCHHLRAGNKSDLQRISRIFSGNAIGLVLGGGGCRAYAHLGVYQALQELQVPVDYIGGSSGGACMGAILAYDYSVEDAIAIIREKAAGNADRLGDYTLPMLALYKGAQCDKILQETYGKHHLIENLWIHFFAIATNINADSMAVLDRGPVWKAVRASGSLPGIFPPCKDEHGNCLIDGGIINNLPVDVMRQKIGHGKIIASGFEKEHILDFPSTEGGISGWHLLKNKIIHGKSGFPSLTEVIMLGCLSTSSHNASQLASKADIFIAPKAFEIGMLDFKAIDRAIEIGYAAAMEKAEALLKIASWKHQNSQSFL